MGYYTISLRRAARRGAPQNSIPTYISTALSLLRLEVFAGRLQALLPPLVFHHQNTIHTLYLSITCRRDFLFFLSLSPLV